MRPPTPACRKRGIGSQSSDRCTPCPRSFASSNTLGVIARYREHLPVGPSTPEVDLQEGSTPLVPSLNIGRALGLERLYFKYEGLNPTGSFKDRGMGVAIAKALEAGSRVVMCASTGNTSASMAAYAAPTGVRAIVCVPSGEFAMSKLSQAVMYHAKVLARNRTCGP